MKKVSLLLVLILFVGSLAYFVYDDDPSEIIPARVVVELDLNELQEITLSNRKVIEIKLLEISEVHDRHRGALRSVTVKVAVDGEEVILGSGNYHLPVTVGTVQIDCPVVEGYYKSTSRDAWKLKKDARFRLWPKESPYLAPGTFVYPIKQAWFAGMTQMGNEPTYVPRGEPLEKDIYYHSGLDISGAEGRTEIVSATDGIVILANKELLEGYGDFPGENSRGDVVYVEDPRGWRLYYAHLDSTDSAIKPGATVTMGQRIGFIGKQGASGGYVHLHFEIFTRHRASGEWGSEDAYAYAWEAYVRQYKPYILAIARPHRLVQTGQLTTLDGRRSRSLEGDITGYEWNFSNGTSAEGVLQQRVYEKPGEYSEVLKVMDSKGNTDYDFTVVQVYDREDPNRAIPTIHASFYPTLEISAGEPVTFMVRFLSPKTGRPSGILATGRPR